MQKFSHYMESDSDSNPKGSFTPSNLRHHNTLYVHGQTHSACHSARQKIKGAARQCYNDGDGVSVNRP